MQQSATLAAGLLTPALSSNVFAANENATFKTRGVVVSVDDLQTLNWAKLARDSGLTTIGTHIYPQQVTEFIGTKKGEHFLEQCDTYKINVEHELHSMEDLLPRSLFAKNPEIFRMDEQGTRMKEYNCCPSSPVALSIIAENAVKYAEKLTPTTFRFFYWIDDLKPMCKCNSCRNLNDADQALLIENAMIKELRKKYPSASLAHLAYGNTMIPPVNIKPEKGIFLEFAPVFRQWDKTLSDNDGKYVWDDNTILSHTTTVNRLHENLKIFPSDTAQVLEYWLDVSLQNKYTKPAKKVIWYPDIFKKDIDIYKKAGVKHITTFAVYIDGEYKKKYRDLSFVKEYANILKKA